MKELRDKIDSIDMVIIKKISQRMAVAKKIGQLKIKLNKPVLDKKREQQLAKMYTKLSKQHELKPEFVQELFEMIIRYSRRVQK
ncbi:MAG TPA: chorismate mutase [Gammaproteobacteria bacterium]|nr:chorismate mutase [Gammaproteobacteria bacterium]